MDEENTSLCVARDMLYNGPNVSSDWCVRMLSEGFASLSLVVPVYNCAGTVQTLYQEVAAVLPPARYQFEVVFVDDGSTDGTYEQLTILAKEHAEVHVVRHKNHYGQSAALVTGARAARYPLLVTIQGDGQNDPSDLPHLLDVFDDIQTAVFGYCERESRNGLPIFLSHLLDGIKRWWFIGEGKDTKLALKVFSREVFLDLPHFENAHPFLPALFKRAGCHVVYVPVRRRQCPQGIKRQEGSCRWFRGLYDAMGVRWLVKRPCVPEIYHYEH